MVRRHLRPSMGRTALRVLGRNAEEGRVIDSRVPHQCHLSSVRSERLFCTQRVRGSTPLGGSNAFVVELADTVGSNPVVERRSRFESERRYQLRIARQRCARYGSAARVTASQGRARHGYRVGVTQSGRVLPCQGRCRGFDPLLRLHGVGQ